jgi:GntR family transcriptional regulator
LDLDTLAIPAYLRIEQDLRRQIEAGALRAGDQLPPEEELSARYSVARMTVRQALGRLVSAGLLLRRRGVGTFVAVPKIERVTNRLLGFEEDAAAHGLHPVTEVLDRSWVRLARDEAEALGEEPGARAFRVDRRRLADGEPIALNTVILPHATGRMLQDHDFAGSLYTAVADALGSPVNHAEQRVEAVTADATQAELLDIEEGSALLRVQRVTFLADGRLLGLTRSHYRGDRYFLALRVER